MKTIKFTLLAVFLFIGHVAADKDYIVKITTEPAGAVLSVNGKFLDTCPKTPCVIELYGNSAKITAVLNEYEVKDTSIVVTQSNQTVAIKLEPKTYLVRFTSVPSGAILKLDGVFDIRCFETPCQARFKKGLIEVNAALEQYETVDTIFFVGKADSSNMYIKLKSIFGILNVRPAYLDYAGIDEWSFSFNGAPSSFGEKKLLPGVYAIRLSNRWYEDIVDSVVIRNNESTEFDVLGKLKPKWGVLEVQPAYLNDICSDEPWKWTVNSKEFPFGRKALLPDKYTIVLTHRCYKDIEFDADIKKNGTVSFNMSKKLRLSLEYKRFYNQAVEGTTKRRPPLTK